MLVFVACLCFFWLAWHTMLTFLFAILFAYLWEPVIPWLERRLHVRRSHAVGIIYLILVLTVGTFLLFVGPKLVRQAGYLARIAPTLENNVASGQIAHQIGNARGWSWQTQQNLQEFLSHHQKDIDAIERDVVSELGSIAGYLPWIALVPVLAIFFMMNGARIQDALLRQISLNQRGMAAGVLADLHAVLANYIRAQIILTAIALPVYLGGFFALRIPYPVALAVFAGLLEFIPILGPLTSFCTVLLVSFMLNYPHLLLLVIFLGAWRVVQDYVNSPRIMGGQVQLAPLAVLFGALAGGEIGGIVGVYLSVPIMASLRVVWRRWRSYHKHQHHAARGD